MSKRGSTISGGKSRFYTRIPVMALFLFVLSFLVYANTLGNEFAFDDKGLIIENPQINSGAPLTEIFTTNYRFGIGFTTESLYRPLVILSYMMNSPGSDLNPRSFHLVNILLHALATVFVFLLCGIVFKSRSLSFITALLFAVHPIHTEAVANVSGRPELMTALFLVSGWYAFERGLLRNRTRWFSLAGVLMFSALLSKETAAVFPFMLVGVDILTGRFPGRSTRDPNWLKYGIVCGIMIMYAVLRISVLGDAVTGHVPHFVDNPVFTATASARIATALGVLLSYIRLLIFPIGLSADYSFNQIPVEPSLIGIFPLAGLAVLAALAIFTITHRHRNVVLGSAIILFIFPYLLISNLMFPVGTIMGERLLYVPSIGFCLAVAAGFDALSRRHQTAVYGSLILLLVWFSSLTVMRNRDWKDDFTLFTADVSSSPRSTKIHANLGHLYRTQSRFQDAISSYRTALDIYPESVVAMRGIARTYYDLKEYELAVNWYAVAVKQEPDNSEHRYDYGLVLSRSGQFEAAVEQLSMAITLDPSTPLPYQELGNVRLEQERFDEAITLFRSAINRGGDPRLNYNNLAAAAYFKGEYKEALGYVTLAERQGIRLVQEMVQAIRAAAEDE
jgi:protein O-mannosyl-transferase